MGNNNGGAGRAPQISKLKHLIVALIAGGKRQML